MQNINHKSFRQGTECKVSAKNADEKYHLLPGNDGRIGEGGLRTRGNFKRSAPGKPLITIVTPVYNGAEFIEETILSVVNQTYDNIEYLIFDGGSSDGTIEIVKKYEDLIDYWVSEPDQGMYHALEKGFDLAMGDIFGWLNADDTYFRWSLNIISKVFTDNQNVEWITGVPTMADTEGAVFNIEHPKVYFRPLIRLGVYRGDGLGFIQQESTFFRSRLYKKHRIDSRLQYAADYKLWTDFAETTNLVTIKTILAAFRKRPGQKSADMLSYYSECNRIKPLSKYLIFMKYIMRPIQVLVVAKMLRIKPKVMPCSD